MSWTKNSFREAYNRADSKVRANKEHEAELQAEWWCDYVDSLNWDGHKGGPTMEDVRYGWLLHLLTRLNLKSAEILLRHWEW